MDEFNRALAEFLVGDVQFSELDAALRRCLDADPTAGPAAFAAIHQAHSAGYLTIELFAHLKRRIAHSQADASRSVMSGPRAPAGPTTGPGSTGPTGPAGTGPTGPANAGWRPGGTVEMPIARAPTGPAPTGTATTGAGATGSGRTGGTTGTGPATSATGGTTGTGPATSATGGTGPAGSTSAPAQTGGSASTWGTGSSVWPDGQGRQPPRSTEAGSILKNRFVLESVVGRGGMGVVFKARDLLKEEARDRNPYVAIKVLNDEFRHHPQSLQALQRESRKAQALAHPNIATVFDFDRDGTTVYMQMEFLEGDSLDKITRNEHFYGIPLPKALPLIQGLGRALAYAHGKGIVHSDFKPGNCFLTKEGVIKVFDFGIARAAKLPDQSVEMTMFDPGVLGALTPAYASCEMIEGGQPDPRDDIYALGCVAYEILTGRHPFDRRSAVKARNEGLVAAPVKGLNGRQQRALQKALAFRREDRCRNVEEFLDAFERQRLDPRMVVGAAGAVAVALAAVLLLPGYLEQRGIDALVAELASGDRARTEAALDDFRALDAAAYRDVLPVVRDPLMTYFAEEVASLIDVDAGRYGFAQAQALLAEASDVLIDPRLSELGGDVDARRRALLNELDSRFNEALVDGRLVPDAAGDSVPDVLDVLAQVDAEHPLLTDPRLPLAYANAAGAAMDGGDLDRAARLIELGLARFPSNRLVDLEDSLAAARRNLQADEAVEEGTAPEQLERLATLLATAAYDAAVEREISVLLTSLETAMPAGNEAFQEIRWDAARWYLTRAAEMRDQERFALARGFLDRAATLVPDLEDLDGARAALTEAERQAEIDRTAEAAAAVIEGRKSSFAAAVEANDLEQALAMLDDLRARLPDDDEFLTETAPAALAGVYLALAQEAAGSGDLVAAEQYAREGRLVAPSNRLFEGFLSDIGAGGRTECTAVLAGRGAAPDLAGACWDMLDADVRGPVLVVIPGGEGSARPFGLGRFETSVADWNRYCGLSGECELRAGAEDDPLTNVAVADIERYASWLSERTGAAYRLPTLTEWHYAANQPHFDRNDNCRSDSMRSVLAGSTNQWGLVDYLGNVRERVSDGSRLVFRGGSYADTLCSVNLGAEDAGAPDPVTGFRLVRELAAAQ